MAWTYRKYNNGDEMINKANEYFAKCDLEDKAYTMVGMLMHLEIADSTWYQYQKGDFGDSLSDACRQIKRRIEEYCLQKGWKGNNFANWYLSRAKGFTYIEKQQVEHSGDAFAPIQIILADTKTAKDANK